MAIPTVKEANDIKNKLLADYVQHKIDAKELVDLVFNAGYAHCYKTYLALPENK